MSGKNEEFIISYMNEVKTQFESGHAKEHAYRPALERLMSSFENVIAVNDPKRSAHGNPDFVFLNPKNKDIILGYAEAKDVDISLDKTEKTDQLLRYAGYENLFLTNYLEFRFYQNGNKYETISIASIENGQLKINPESYSHLADELQQFLELPPETIKSGKRLAQIMGAKARRIRDNVKIYLENNEDEKNQELEKMFTMMKELLVHDLTIEKFADMYAQTLVYGLFVARYNDKSPDNFTRSEARDLVPASNPFLREFFDHIVGPRFDKRLAYIVDELCEVFSVSDVNALVHKHLRILETIDEKDPIIHFYEDFLKEYDPDERRKMGAYYTPLPIVRFIVKEVDTILKREFGIAKGIADTEKKTITVERQGKKVKQEVHRVQILDPAVGTATFLNEVIKQIHDTFKGQEGRWPSYVENDLLPRLYGFELMMAPYTIAHLKLGMTLQEMGVKDLKQRIGVYLTNTLEEGIKRQPDLFSYGLAEVVSEESHEASIIKHEKPIMVVIGNPPYSVSSNNKSDFIQTLIKDYKKDLNERKINLDDDYIKFIRFAEDMIEKNGSGVVAMITNNSFIDGLTHRQMRKHLLETFDNIYILDLHGNSKKLEVSPDGSKDENVFDIMQGVSINLFVKKSANKKTLGNIYHSELFGTRTAKFEKLGEPADWQKLTVREPDYFFTPKDLSLQEDYFKNISISNLFLKSNSGVETSKDSLVVAFDRKTIEDRWNDFVTLDLNDLTNKYNDQKKEKLEEVKNDIMNVVGSSTKILYRPFDLRYTIYSKNSAGVLWRPRFDIMQHMIQPNLGLIAKRGLSEEKSAVGFISDTLIDRRSWSRPGMLGAESIFPLYLYQSDGSRTPNFRPEAIKELTKNLQNTFQPEDILDYIYAVLFSPTYIDRYKEFLKIDFPRIPIPKNDSEFQRLISFGKELRGLHLMTSPKIIDFITTYPVEGENEVEKVSYENGSVYINKDQYFGNVPEVAWNIYIGGYQPAQKWLKDRKGRTLTNVDIEHYQKVIKVLFETNKVMQEIGALDS